MACAHTGAATPTGARAEPTLSGAVTPLALSSAADPRLRVAAKTARTHGARSSAATGRATSRPRTSAIRSRPLCVTRGWTRAPLPPQPSDLHICQAPAFAMPDQHRGPLKLAPPAGREGRPQCLAWLSAPLQHAPLQPSAPASLGPAPSWSPARAAKSSISARSSPRLCRLVGCAPSGRSGRGRSSTLQSLT